MILRRLYLRFRRPMALLAIILAIGTYGYWIIGGETVSLIERDEQALDAFRQRNPGVPAFPGDASEDEALREAGIDHAAGVFAVTGDDSKNLVVTLSAKALNPAVRVVARCHEVNYIEKIRKVGADAIVSPDYSGAMRVVSSMLRPNVTRFLDEMTGTDRPVRVEEIKVATHADGRTIGELGLRSHDRVILAVHGAEGWRLHPEPNDRLRAGEVIVAMVTPKGHAELTSKLSSPG